MNGPIIATKRLSSINRRALVAHFRALSNEDRRLRFGAGLSDSALTAYVGRIEFGRDAVYGVYSNDLTLSGVAHVASGDDTAELGVSVLDGYRRHGIGSALFERAGIWACNHGARILFTHCLSENAVMMHIAKKSRMQIVSSSGEADAYLKLAPASVSTVTGEMLHDGTAVFDHALKSYVMATQRLWRIA
jgi:GNAT superfamily N-acetyltransferase